ncbi:MAG: PIN domain-containing protein [Gloeomargarita sp. SKYBB_i_bin120]|nr:PIN domain-containing protein [Gloeomargarita sp. SKYG98]MCS7291922.1 PIN domain-containing protein [Gloeomargarita sp. SKYB120]MDW8177482.1 PIN domain-containing protein [Gloeomargarita sp. SKYBB_i_bin120]
MKIVVDTSIWIDYFRSGNPVLRNLLETSRVCIHEMIIGELALGNFKNRHRVLSFLRDLPSLPLVSHERVLDFVERHQLMGSGIGWVDAHLLAATAQTQYQLWTRDKRLLTVAQSLQLAYCPS